MLAAHVTLRLTDRCPYFVLERSVNTEFGSRKKHIAYLGKRPLISPELRAKYNVYNGYGWLLNERDHVLRKFLQDFVERRLSQRIKGV